MKHLGWLLAFFLALPVVFGQCIIPSEGMVITANTELCPDSYRLSKGIVIGADNVLLDCNDAVLIGSFVGAGIALEGVQGVTIEHCSIANFEQGISLVDARDNTIRDNILQDNTVGVQLIRSYENVLKDNSATSLPVVSKSAFNIIHFANRVITGDYCVTNSCNSITTLDPCVSFDDYCSVHCNSQNDADCKETTILLSAENAIRLYKQQSVDLLDDILARTNVDEMKRQVLRASYLGEQAVIPLQDPGKAVNRFTSRSEYDYALSKLNITKTVSLQNHTTVFIITIIPQEKVTNLVVYEYFPEILRGLDVEVKEEAAIFSFDEVKEPITISYAASERALLQELPITIPSLEPAVFASTPPTLQEQLWVQIAYYIIGYILIFLLFQFVLYRKHI